MTKINSPREIFITKLQVLYDIEKQLEKALPKLESAATNSQLKDGFRRHLEETQEHSRRLERAFEMLEVKPKKLESEGIRGIIQDSDWVMKVKSSDSIKDSMIAGSARYAEHYEIAGYTTAIEEANILGLEDIVPLLSETLEEEMAADENLSEAMSENLTAALNSSENDDESDDVDVASDDEE